MACQVHSVVTDGRVSKEVYVLPHFVHSFHVLLQLVRSDIAEILKTLLNAGAVGREDCQARHSVSLLYGSFVHSLHGVFEDLLGGYNVGAEWVWYCHVEVESLLVLYDHGFLNVTHELADFRKVGWSLHSRSSLLVCIRKVILCGLGEDASQMVQFRSREWTIPPGLKLNRNRVLQVWCVD